jgi:hypothetical protein
MINDQVHKITKSRNPEQAGAYRYAFYHETAVRGGEDKILPPNDKWQHHEILTLNNIERKSTA